MTIPSWKLVTDVVIIVDIKITSIHNNFYSVTMQQQRLLQTVKLHDIVS